MMSRTTLKLLFFFGLVCSPIAAQETIESIVSSYSITGCRYWFDNSTQVTQTNYANGKIALDVSSLEEGFHTLHYQILDSRGEVSPARTSPFFRLQPSEERFKDYTIKNVRYWFDKDYAPREVAYVGGTSSIDVSALEEGFHTLHYQVIDSKGETSPSRTSSFFRVQPTDEKFKDYTIKNLRYWFDKDYTPREVAYAGGTSSIDVSALEEGFHTLHYQVIDSKGESSPSRTSSFFRVQPTDEKFKDYTIKNVRYWFDKDYTPREVAYAGGTSSIDVSALEEGFHTLHYQVIDSKGETSPSRTIPFFRVQPVEEKFKNYTVKIVNYWFDNDISTLKTETFDARATTFNLSFLPEGSHTLYYQVMTDGGQVSPARSVAFERWLYDIYVKESTEYNAATISSDPLFGNNPWLKLHYSADDTAIRGRLTVNEGVTLSLGKYLQAGNLGTYSRYNNYDFTSPGANNYHPTSLINQGFMRADSVKVSENVYHDRWHFISLPFNAAVSNIDMPDNTYWALRRYDGEARAAGITEATWQNLRPGDTMEAGQGYILQLTREGNDKITLLTFKAENDMRKNDIFKSEDAEVTLSEHLSEFAHNRSWNLTGNPYPSFFDTRFIEPGGTIIVWNGNGYSAYSLTDDDYVLMPFEAFFIQKPLDGSVLTFSAEGRQHTHEVRSIAPARTRQAFNMDRQIVNITVTDGRQSDRTRLVINERASSVYEADKDAPKFFAGNDMDGNSDELPPTVQLYSVEAAVKYAINERPMGDGYATLSIIVPQNGDYSLQIEGPSELMEKMAILDTETGRTWTAADGELTFSATAGRHDGRFVIAFDGQTTGIGQQTITADGEMSVIDGQLTFHFARERNVKIYATDGRLLYSLQGDNGTTRLDSGIYLINVDGKTTKVIVK